MIRGIRGWAAAGLAMLGAAACTVLLDRNASQCHSDSDCTHFGGHPTCDVAHGVCVASGLQPADCFLGTPEENSQFLNQCSLNYLPGEPAGSCLTFDCSPLGLCTGSDAGDELTPPPIADASTPAVEAGSAASIPNCIDDTAGRARANVVFLSGSSNFVALLKKMASIITTQTSLVPVFRITDSCTGARSMYPASATTDHIITDPAPGGTYAQYYDAAGAHDCLLGSDGVAVDVGESEIFPETCGLQPDPMDVSHHPGPILPILFVVPKKSLESTISADAARYVLGNGGVGPAGPVAPWTQPTSYYIRGAATATARLIGLAIGLPIPPNRLWGIDQGTAQKLAANLALVTDPTVADETIGLLGSDSYDADRFNLKALAFQAGDQECAYLPDSTLFSLDKINVRDGHYPIWGTLHFYAAISNGAYVSPQAQAFLVPFSQSQLPIDFLNAFIDSSWVPECAMQVERLTEMGDFRTDMEPAYPCGCYFDTRVTMKTPAGCNACMTANDCIDPAKPACNFGFCEAPSAQ